jgi:diaminopimelate decarboxylase
VTDHLETVPQASWSERLEALAAAEGLECRPTPLLALDLDTMSANIARMAAAFAGRPSAVRPHVKTHKCTEIARRQVAVHGRGVTCSTTDEVGARSSSCWRARRARRAPTSASSSSATSAWAATA